MKKSIMFFAFVLTIASVSFGQKSYKPFSIYAQLNASELIEGNYLITGGLEFNRFQFGLTAGSEELAGGFGQGTNFGGVANVYLRKKRKGLYAGVAVESISNDLASQETISPRIGYRWFPLGGLIYADLGVASEYEIGSDVSSITNSPQPYAAVGARISLGKKKESKKKKF